MKTFLLLLCLVFAVGAAAQDSLLVFELKGKAYLKTLDNKIQPLKVGNKFYAYHSRLEIDKGSSITLVSDTYKALTFTKSMAMVDIRKTFHPGKNTDVTGKYFAYVWEQFTHKHGSPEADRRKYMSNAGGVARGCPGVDADHLPDTIYYTGKSLVFNITHKLPAGRLQLAFQNADSAWRINVDPSAVFFPATEQLKPGTSWKWFLLIDRQQPCKEGVIIYMTRAQYLLKEKELNKQVIVSDPLEASNMLAFLLEASGYLDAAQDIYRNNH
ncbi:hypothetical protein [Terrimonas ferruginea]|uniref:hypothetical protein n=1 Tax=Terrimonas ferruginea TaxID=249 RepID=UPI000410E403|nr:hypothetical protein [Terrimonas ferruginea]